MSTALINSQIKSGICNSLLIGVLILALNGCTGLGDKKDSGGIQVDDEGLIIDPFYDVPETPESNLDSYPDGDERYPQPSVEAPNISTKPTSQTVLALLNQAKIQEQAGNSERAAAVLERALRIEPKNAQLWHRLALLRLQQGKLGLAESLAQKSSALARDDDLLKRKNKTIVDQARILQGKE